MQHSLLSLASHPSLPLPCPQVLGIPRVALLLLTRGPMHHEEMWRLWLGSAAGQLPVRSAQAS